MKFELDTDKIEEASVFGELLREHCFTKGRGYGCYSNFELEPEFKKIRDEQFIEEILTSDQIYGEGYFQDDENNEVKEYLYEDLLNNCYTNGEIKLAWEWDGDGTLVIKVKDKMVINKDCKKDYTWEWISYEGN